MARTVSSAGNGRHSIGGVNLVATVKRIKVRCWLSFLTLLRAQSSVLHGSDRALTLVCVVWRDRRGRPNSRPRGRLSRALLVETGEAAR